MGSTRRTFSLFGGLTAAATTVGAVPLAHVAEAAPAPDPATDDTGTLGTAQDGTFEPCSAYFGFGKEYGEVPNLTQFEVVDESGDDEGGHAVPDDVQVVLVIETAEGDTVECEPVAVTEAEWDEAIDDHYWGTYRDVPAFPDRPVYPYPSVSDPDDFQPVQYIEGLGLVTAVGYRVVGLPSDHQLVSPAGLQPLPDQFGRLLDWGDAEADPDVLTYLEGQLGAEAAQAYADAMADCHGAGEGPFDDGEDPVLIAAIQALLDLTGYTGTTLDVNCNDVIYLEPYAIDALAILRAAAHVEVITLAGPTVPEQPVPPAPTPPAAQPVTAAPSFTG